MIRNTQLLVLCVALSWASAEAHRNFGRYPRYFTQRPRYDRRPFIKLFRPLSYCMRMVYGKDVFFHLSSSFTSPMRTIDESSAQDDIKKTYGNVFRTVSELKASLGESPSTFSKMRDDLQSSDGNNAFSASYSGGDNNRAFQINSDVCCSTNEVFFINDTLIDLENIPRKIAQLSKIGAYQFIRHGLCAFKGACQGNCVQHYINLPLAVDEPGIGLPITFRFFKIPGYCSCIIIGF